MKNFLPLFLLVALACAGCSSQYSLVLNNGDVITTQGKPKYVPEQGCYYYKDAAGHDRRISASGVREVAPSSMITKDDKQFSK